MNGAVLERMRTAGFRSKIFGFELEGVNYSIRVVPQRQGIVYLAQGLVSKFSTGLFEHSILNTVATLQNGLEMYD